MCAASFLAFANALNQGVAYPGIHPAERSRPKGETGDGDLVLSASAPPSPGTSSSTAKSSFTGLGNSMTSLRGRTKLLLWMPQSLMLIGAVILAIALTDHLLNLIFKGNHRIEREIAGRRGRMMENVSLIILFLFVLFTPAWHRRLGRPCSDGRCLGGDGVVHHPPRWRRDADDIWAASLVLDPDRPAALHLDGRNLVSNPIIGGHVQGPSPLDGQSCRAVLVIRISSAAPCLRLYPARLPRR